MNRGIALLAAGVVAVTAASLPVQLAFAISGIGVVGMVHGAGDLAAVEPARRPLFLTTYGVVSVATMLCWTTDSAIPLPAFLVASTAHVGIEDAPDGPLSERIARGVALVVAPATLHASGYAALLRTAGGPSSMLATYTPTPAAAGGVAVILLHFDPSGERGHFAGIAALAVPHLLVTPWFERRKTPDRRAIIAEIARCSNRSAYPRYSRSSSLPPP